MDNNVARYTRSSNIIVSLFDDVYFTESLEEIKWRPNQPKPSRPAHPIKHTVVAIQRLDNGTFLYHTDLGYFHESWIGNRVFLTKEEAETNFPDTIDYSTRLTSLPQGFCGLFNKRGISQE